MAIRKDLSGLHQVLWSNSCSHCPASFCLRIDEASIDRNHYADRQPISSDRWTEEFQPCTAHEDFWWKKINFWFIQNPFKHLQLMIGQNHRVDLNGIDQVGVVAHHARQFDFADFLQLLGRERRRLIGQFIPEAVASSQVAELRGDDASEDRSQHGAGQRLFRHAAAPQVNVERMLEDALITAHGLVRHWSEEFVKVFGDVKAAELAELAEAGHAELTSALHVERHQVHAEAWAFLLEQMIRDLLRDWVVHGLRNLVHQAHQILVHNASAVHVERTTNEIGKSFRRDEFVGLRPSLDSCRQLESEMKSVKMVMYAANEVA